MSYFYQHVRTSNDTNGNPRRCYVVYRLDAGGCDCVAVFDEGYSGLPRLLRDMPSVYPVDVLATAYHGFLKLGKRALDQYGEFTGGKRSRADQLKAFAEHVLNEQLSHGEHGDAEYIRLARAALDVSREEEVHG